LMFIGALTCWFVKRDLSSPDKPRMVFRRRYSLYYGLTFLEGCRKHVFITFAVYVLVHRFNTPMHLVAMLMLINNVVNLTLAPFVGRLIDRIGEKRVLATSYSCLIFVFIGYGLIKSVGILYVLYCLDNLLYLSTYGLTTYLSRTADEQDIVPSLSMGVTMNHLAAVAVPVTGGLIWSSVGYTYTFIAGAGVVMVSLFLALHVDNSKSLCGN